MSIVSEGKTCAFLVSYTSENNLFSGKKFIDASGLVEAQDLFFAWLKEQGVYSHLWRLTFNIELVEV